MTTGQVSRYKTGQITNSQHSGTGGIPETAPMA